MRVRELPFSGAGKKRNGEETPNTVFNATKTVVTDANGVLGVVEGLPTSYTRKTVAINTSTPSASVTKLGNISIRLNGTSDSGEQTLEFLLNASPSHVSIWGEKMGSGYAGGLSPYGSSYTTVTTTTNIWKETGMKINPSNRDMVRYTLNLHNTKEVYRVSVVSNASISASSGVESVPAQITIFIEKLD